MTDLLLKVGSDPVSEASVLVSWPSLLRKIFSDAFILRHDPSQVVKAVYCVLIHTTLVPPKQVQESVIIIRVIGKH